MKVQPEILCVIYDHIRFKDFTEFAKQTAEKHGLKVKYQNPEYFGSSIVKNAELVVVHEMFENVATAYEAEGVTVIRYPAADSGAKEAKPKAATAPRAAKK